MRKSNKELQKELINYGIISFVTDASTISIRFGNCTFDLVNDKDGCFGFFKSNIVLSITTKICTLKLFIQNNKSHLIIK